MNEEQYVDLFTAKERVIRQLRDCGAQSYSRLLLSTLLPEQVLNTALSLLQNEKRVSLKQRSEDNEEVYQPVSGLFSSSFNQR